MQTATDIVEFEVCASDRASVFLVSSIVLSIDALVIGEIYVVAFWVSVYWQVVILARVRQVPVAFSRRSAILMVGHFVTV
jgi:hypothetical protein